MSGIRRYADIKVLYIQPHRQAPTDSYSLLMGSKRTVLSKRCSAQNVSDKRNHLFYVFVFAPVNSERLFSPGSSNNNGPWNVKLVASGKKCPKLIEPNIICTLQTDVRFYLKLLSLSFTQTAESSHALTGLVENVLSDSRRPLLRKGRIQWISSNHTEQE